MLLHPFSCLQKPPANYQTVAVLMASVFPSSSCHAFAQSLREKNLYTLELPRTTAINTDKTNKITQNKLAGREEVHDDDDQGAGALPLRGQAERFGVVQSGEDPGRP